MKKAVFALASNEEQAQRIVNRLQSAGFSNNDISVLFPHRDERSKKGDYEEFAEGDQGRSVKNLKKGSLGHEKHTKAPEGGTTGALAGGVVGGSIGLLAGIGTLAIPGLGPFIAAGPLLAALSGTAIGGSLGLLIGSLVGMGIPEYEAKKYQEGLKSGNFLICVHAENSEQIERAQTLLKKEGASDISTTSESARAR